MVIFLRKELLISEYGKEARCIPDMNIRPLFVFPYRMWSKLPPLHPAKPLKHPVRHVIASWTNTMECWHEWECVREMWKLQQHYREKGQDIPYNFVVGGDSNVYECRGWNAQPEKCDRHPKLEGVSIEIAHIGWKCEDRRDPYTGMCHQAYMLMELGIEKGYLIEDLDFQPDYDPLHDTPWSGKSEAEMKNMKEKEDEDMKQYMDDLMEDEKKEGDATTVKFV